MGMKPWYVELSLAALIVAWTATGARADAQNLLENGQFEKGLNSQGEPVGWHTRVTSVIPVPEYADPQRKRGRTGKYTFKCGCDYVWGQVRPWTNLLCPQCKQMNLGLEDSDDWYLKNFESVSLGEGKSGKGVRIRMSEAVGNMQGVRVVSDLIKVQRDAGYEISFDALAQGTSLKVFVEGFRILEDDKEAQEWVKTLPAISNPLKLTSRLKRVFRAQVPPHGAGGSWSHFSDRFVAPQRNQFDYMFVTLYAYLPGEAAYDNVVLRKLTSSELADYLKENPGPKDPRLR